MVFVELVRCRDTLDSVPLRGNFRVPSEVGDYWSVLVKNMYLVVRHLYSSFLTCV